ncbi:MAG: ammonium transporter [Candidatus Accumulibacter sp.]|jgi:Amt family ammonium transporter|uniref:ammonium transporter n=1 Tax=Candidatus Accumulibacter TaxID=327159 RepID=UPI001AC26E24|nr:ammonium transporter [Accumulibacter sp.]MBK8114917.1 ammonium transporter [Accumulibacter sp.]MBK8387243.1 ammonium transporter [Accumulibacter sp.]MBK8578395.1 ammonium transporter [Candidatus Accumulibacter propinquus]MBN8439387.1 ammonium transporter [Accumulibacter sp.]
MRRIFAILALLGAVSIGAPAWAEEKPAAAPATTTAVAAPAAADAASAAPATAAAAPAPVANKGDNAWVMTSAALVILMSIPGLALFYGGLVRTKNMLSVLMQVFVTFSLISVLWVVYGYSVAFTEGGGFFGVLDKIFLKGITVDSVAATFSKGVVISELAYVVFQGAFAAITCGLIVGAFAERAKFAAILVFMVIWFTLSYLPMAHMVWYWAGPDAYVDAAAGEAAGKTAGFLFQKGALDFAGGTVVHINAAMAGLVGALLIGKRIGYGRESMAPHSLTFTMIGASLLWFGWFGFNAGSALEASGGAALAMVNTWVATACAAMSWMLAEWALKGKPSMLGAASGAVAGLVAITPAAGFVGVVGAIAIGLLAGVVCLWGVNGLKRMLGADDSLDVFGVHGVGGILGAILTGVFADPALGGTGVYDYVLNKVGDYDMTAQVISQLWGVGTVIVWSGVVSLVAFKLVDMVIGLRVPEEEEREGLDITSHGESAYHY